MSMCVKKQLNALFLFIIIPFFVLNSGISAAQDQILVRGYIAAQVGQSSLDKEFSMFFEGASQQQIHLPDVQVFLRDISGSGSSSTNITDLSGRFSVYVDQPGKYQLCWKSAAYGGGCLSERNAIHVTDKPRFVSTLTVPVERLPRHSGLIGKVSMANGDNVRHYEPYLNLNSFATIRLLDPNGEVVSEVFVNNAGYYLLPNVPVNQSMILEAVIGSESVRQEVAPQARLNGNSVYQVNLRFANDAPQIKNITVVNTSGDRVQNVTPGETVILSVNAGDRDNDQLRYRWQDTEIIGAISANDQPQIKWKLPQSPGRHNLTVLVYDQRGGYDKQTISLLADGKGIPFGGMVVDTQGNPIAGVKVQIVGNNAVKTNQQGRFNVRVKESERYVLNIRKKGFALNSRVYDRGVSDGRWVMARGQVVTVNPLVDTTIMHDRSEKDCTGPSSMTADLGVAGKSLLTPQWQDGSGNIIDAPVVNTRPIKPVIVKNPRALEPKLSFFERIRAFFRFKPKVEPELVLKPVETKVVVDELKASFVMPRNIDLRRCGPGVSIALPAKSVKDKNGDVVTTPFEVTIATVDVLSPQQMPGDESVIPIGGGGGYIESFGAGSLDLPEGFTLGNPAEVVIPVDRSRSLDNDPLPATVPYLTYDEEKGLWVEESVMQLKTVNGIESYVGKATHFSAFNADNVKNATAACVRVFSPDLPSNYDLEVAAPIGNNGAIRILKKPIDNSSSTEHVIYNLPSQTNITLAPMSQGANPQLYGYFVVNSGPSQNPSNSPSVPPGPPYTSCTNEIILTTGQAPNAPFGGEFLNGIGFLGALNSGINEDLTFSGPTGNALRDAIADASKDYYNSIDPNGDFDTLDKFRTQHGFSLDPNNPAADEIVVSYANSGDLGFGRDMHCRVNNGDYACYVSNYGTGYDNNATGGGGTPDVDDATAAATRTTVGNSNEIATVAMDYTTIPGQANRIVKFYVYKKGFPGVGDYGRSISANLDGRGERPVPQLCMVCHGGNIPEHSANGVPLFSTPAQVDFNSRFVPFDHRFFTFANGSPPSNAQEDAIRDLNQLIVDNIPANTLATDPIREVIDKMYSGVAPNHQNVNSTVDGWDTGNSANVPNQKAFYDDVFTSTCRMCHIAQPFQSLQFQNSDQFLHLNNGQVSGNNFLMLGTVQSRLCGDYLMPHALRTHDIFWGRYTDNIDPAYTAPNLVMSNDFQSFGDTAVGANTALTWKAGLCNSFVSTNVSNPSNFYQQTVQPIFNSKCVGCHIAGSQSGAGFLPLTDSVSHPNLLLNNRVIPGNDNAGTLLTRITETTPGPSRMPPNCFRAPEAPNGNLPCLLQSEVDKIKVWIRNGAN